MRPLRWFAAVPVRVGARESSFAPPPAPRLPVQAMWVTRPPRMCVHHARPTWWFRPPPTRAPRLKLVAIDALRRAPATWVTRPPRMCVHHARPTWWFRRPPTCDPRLGLAAIDALPLRRAPQKCAHHCVRPAWWLRPPPTCEPRSRELATIGVPPPHLRLFGVSPWVTACLPQCPPVIHGPHSPPAAELLSTLPFVALSLKPNAMLVGAVRKCTHTSSSHPHRSLRTHSGRPMPHRFGPPTTELAHTGIR